MWVQVTVWSHPPSVGWHEGDVGAGVLLPSEGLHVGDVGAGVLLEATHPLRVDM